MRCPSCQQPAPESAQTCAACGAPLAALPAGTRLQDYRIERLLHRDGGLSYAAIHEPTGTSVVLLEFFPPNARRFGLLALLDETHKRELALWLERARTWRSYPGPYLRRPTEVFERNATGYAVMPPPPGRTLAAQVASAGPLPGPDVAQLVGDLARALHEALEAGLPVGELDPARVSLSGEQQWLNLGWADGGHEAYRAPEAWTGLPSPTPASLLYSLGAVAQFALTGQAPPAAPYRALGQPPAPLPVGLPQALEQFIEQATQLTPHQRPASLGDVPALLRGQPSRGAHGHTEQQEIRVPAHRSWVTHLVLQGQVLVSAGADQQVRVWTLDGRPVSTLEGLRANPVGLRLLPAGIVVADARGRVQCWAGNTSQAADSGAGLQGLCALGKDRVVTLDDRQHLHLWKVPEVQLLGHDAQAGQQVTAMHEGPEGTLVLGTRDGEIMLYEPQRMQRTSLLSGLPGPVTSLVVGQRGHIFAASGFTVHLVGKGVVATLPNPVHALALGGRLELLFMATGGSLHRLDRPDEVPHPVWEGSASIRCLSATESHLAAGLEDGQVILMRLPEKSGRG